MSARIGIRELHDALAAMIRRVRDGETLEITHEGEALAILAPVRRDPVADLLAGSDLTAPDPAYRSASALSSAGRRHRLPGDRRRPGVPIVDRRPGASRSWVWERVTERSRKPLGAGRSLVGSNPTPSAFDVEMAARGPIPIGDGECIGRWRSLSEVPQWRVSRRSAGTSRSHVDRAVAALAWR
jgi:antitoxin (DNA-binding transcriptional repressor) of toxin-antitoxin stability system